VAIEAVVFDLDGVLLDSEPLWDRARREVVAAHGGRWAPGATEAMQGMSSLEWSRYLHDVLGVRLPPERIVDAVVDRLTQSYAAGLPLVPGASEAVARMAHAWPLGLASSSNRAVIDAVLELSGLAVMFRATVSSEEVAHGKPAPDVYLEAARRLGVPAGRCAAVEDSANGIRSGAAAGMRVVAIPNRAYPPAADALALAAVVLDDIAGLSVDAVRALG
jgi:HAD superfamily hydrolase (TIGR01509 family)